MNGDIKAKNKYTHPVSRVIIAAFVCCLWGSAFPGIKLGYEWLVIDGASSQILFAGIRFTIAGVLTFIYGFATEGKSILANRRDLLPLTGQGLLQTCISYIFFYIGVAHLTGSESSIINSTGAFFSILFAGLVLRSEKLTSRKWIACAFGFAGVIIINLSEGTFGGGFTMLGDGSILLSAMASGVGTVTSKSLTKKMSPVKVTAYQLTIGGVALAILGLATGGAVTGFELKSILLLMYLAALSTVAFVLWTKLLKYNPAGKVSVYGFMIPIFGVVLSGIVLGESIITLQNAIALFLVSAGVFIVNGEKAGQCKICESA